MYRSIDVKFWTDDKVKALNWEARYLLLYLITNPHTHVSGLYYLPFSTILYESGMTEKALRRGIDTLSKGYLCRIDTHFQYVWVVNMLRYQGRGQKIERAVKAQLADFHNCALLNEFRAHYGYPIDTLSDTLSMGGAKHPSPVPVPSSLNSNKESEENAEPSAVEKAVPWPSPDELRNRWNTIPGVKPCKVLGKTIKDKIKARQEDGKDPTMWDTFFQSVANSPFLCGKVAGNKPKPFRASLDWAVGPQNFDKIMAGNYEDEQAKLKLAPDDPFANYPKEAAL